MLPNRPPLSISTLPLIIIVKANKGILSLKFIFCSNALSCSRNGAKMSGCQIDRFLTPDAKLSGPKLSCAELSYIPGKWFSGPQYWGKVLFLKKKNQSGRFWNLCFLNHKNISEIFASAIVLFFFLLRKSCLLGPCVNTFERFFEWNQENYLLPFSFQWI